MAFDGIMMHVVKNELQTRLNNGRINKIYAPSDYELLFNIRANKENLKLLISCHPMYARVGITDIKFTNDPNPKQFVMLLRKHLEGSHIASIEQINLDRIYKFKIYSRNEIGDLETLYMYIEIMGKHSNFILCNENHRIIDCLKRITPSMNTVRFVSPGATYELPPMIDKINPLEVNEVNTNNFNKTCQGISPILSKEILYRLDNGQSFKDIISSITDSRQLYITNSNDKDYFHLIELTHLNGDTKVYDLFTGLDRYFEHIDTKERIKQQTSDLARFVSNELTKNKNKLDKLLATLDDSLNSDELRIKGDLLFASLHLITKGMTMVTVDNYYDGTTLDIELDPRFDGKTNAKRYYAKYQKAKNSLKVLEEQIELTENEIQYFDTIQTHLEFATYTDALEIKEELENLGYIHKKKKKGLQIKKKHPQFETYLTKDDIHIYIGKNNAQNDYLTFKFASRNHLWFHVKDMPGSHVVCEVSEPDEYTLRLCAKIAAYYSKGKNSSSVPVNYAPIRSLKRISKGSLGQVQLSNYKTIYIDPDDDFLNEIKRINI